MNGGIPPELHGGVARRRCFERGLGQGGGTMREMATHEGGGRRRCGLRPIYIGGERKLPPKIHDGD